MTSRSARLRMALLLSLAMSLGARRADAQRVDSLPPGTRVRVSISDSLRQTSFGPRTRGLIATLARVSPDTLWLNVGGPDTLRLPRASVRRMYRSKGASRAASAFELGVFSGVIYSIGAYVSSDRGDRWRRAREVGGAAAGLGLIVGAVSPFERWQRVR